MKKNIRVLIADDHMIVRMGLATLIGLEPDLSVVGEAENGESAIALAKELRPDVIIMDLMMPGLNGADALQQRPAAGRHSGCRRRPARPQPRNRQERRRRAKH